MQVIRITTDNQAEILTIDNTDASRRLSQLQAAVGGLIEFVTIDDGFELIAHEEAIVFEEPLNYYGTLIPRLFDVLVQGICGNVLLVGRVDGPEGSEIADAPAIAYETLARFGFQLEQPK